MASGFEEEIIRGMAFFKKSGTTPSTNPDALLAFSVLKRLFDRESHGHALATDVAQQCDELVTFAQLNTHDAQRVVA